MPATSIVDTTLPLPWEDAAEHVDLVKIKAARQFAAIWRSNKSRDDSVLRWGEEMEYMLVKVDGGRARAALCADEVLLRLGPQTGGEDPTTSAGWRTEYGNMMVEGVTLPPFTWSLNDLLLIEPALAWRRREVQRVATEVDPNLRVVTLANFPLLGARGATSPETEPAPHGEISKSTICPDEATSPHPRYQLFTANYRKRKGCKVAAVVPRAGLPVDQRLPAEELTRLPFRVDPLDTDPVPGHIFMDALAFGACQCCTQVTLLTRNLEEARFLTDQFLVLAPLFLALTAATPFYRGLVSDFDTRMPAFYQTWDDRREDELETVRNSRCSANDLFIGRSLVDDAQREADVNDVQVPVCGAALRCLMEAGVDPVLSRHAAHVLARDPLCVFKDRLEIDDETNNDHWEQLQGTNWGNVRFKPPPGVHSDIGWRVEFRSPEVQLTDFENAAIIATIRVVAQVIVEERIDLAIPVSLCEANDVASSERDAASLGWFWFRDACGVSRRPLSSILSGEGGLLTRCREWTEKRSETGECSAEVKRKLFSYFSLCEDRAAGRLPTPASFLRNLLERHAEYKGDGVLPTSFVHDLCNFAVEVNQPDGVSKAAELLGGA